MYLKCAHPECTSEFDYTQGRLFRFRQTPQNEKQPAHWHGVKHYWLCARCSEKFTIEYQKGVGVLLLERLEKIAGGQPCYAVLQPEIPPKAPSARRTDRPRTRRPAHVEASLEPVPINAMEILETRNT